MERSISTGRATSTSTRQAWSILPRIVLLVVGGVGRVDHEDAVARRAGRDDPTSLERHELVGQAHQPWIVGSDHDGPVPAEALEGADHLARSDRIEVGRGLVEEHVLAVGDERPGDREPADLAAAQAVAARTDDGVEAGRQCVDEPRRADRLQHARELVIGRQWSGDPEVVRDRPVHQVRRLRHPGDNRSPRVAIDRAERPTVDRDPALARLQEPEQEGQDCRLAGAGRTGEHDDATRRQRQVDLGDRGHGTVGIAGGHAEQRDRGGAGELARVRPPRRRLVAVRRRAAPRSGPRRLVRRPRSGTGSPAGAGAGRTQGSRRGRPAPARTRSPRPSAAGSTSTATSATAIDAPHSRTSDVWNAVRRTSIDVSAYRRPRRWIVSTCSALRPKSFNVRIPWRTSRKNAPSQRMSSKRRSVRTRARLPMTASRRTSSGPVASRTSVVGGSISATTTRMNSGTVIASHRAGR